MKEAFIEWVKDILVSWFFKFDVELMRNGKYRIIFKPLFKRDWIGLWGEIFPTKDSARRRADEIRKNSGHLWDVAYKKEVE